MISRPKKEDVPSPKQGKKRQHNSKIRATFSKGGEEEKVFELNEEMPIKFFL